MVMIAAVMMRTIAQYCVRIEEARHLCETGEHRLRGWRLRALRLAGLAARATCAVHRHAALQLVQLRATHTLIVS